MVEFTADKITVYGPKVDGSFRIAFEVGEYEREKIKETVGLMKEGNLYKVRIEADETFRAKKD